MERITGILAGTSNDVAGDIGEFRTLELQMDCIDESSNTTAYLDPVRAGEAVALAQRGTGNPPRLFHCWWLATLHSADSRHFYR